MPPSSPDPVARKRPWSAIATGAGGGAALAVAVAATLVAVGTLHFGSSKKAPVNKTPIDLPERLGVFRDEAAVSAIKGSPDGGAKIRERLDKVSSQTVEAFQQAYGGAGAGVRTYADSDLLHIATVIAVRAPTPGLTDGPVVDPASLGLAVADHAVEQIGDMSCIVNNSPVVAGKAVDPTNTRYSVCERIGPNVTVMVFGNGFTGDEGKQLITDLTDTAFDRAAAS